ncbi:fam-b protein [Plasmodium yoelii]|uniref:Fam-b protein n=2 Tax=Plasmodium yoelii TaxID=5861 RepID=A0AAE9WQ38_PLAYO|nr:fam-b protein [Plasmodium yoelii]WBY56961.1 fam-b protein [Plasmodium yoelii yoelii]CDU17760.1 fam-b protein [Plasmodium yoelii]VTZ77800.1 fam-b protein [Plasmodium yoelii]|eukprot:XP_022812068.1 fam-b protein [Plasmodium yoelii]
MKELNILKKIIFFSIFIYSLEHTKNVLCNLSRANNTTITQPDSLNFKISKLPKKGDYFLDLLHSYDSIINIAAKIYENNEDCGETNGIIENAYSNENQNKFNVFDILGGIITEPEISKSDTSRKSMRVNKNYDKNSDDKNSDKNSDNKNSDKHSDKHSDKKSSGNNCKKKTSLFGAILSKIYICRH